MDIAKEVREIKGAIAAAQQEKSKLEGKIESNMAHLKKEYGLESLEEADKRIAELHVKAERLEKRLEGQIEEINKEFFQQ